MSGVILATNTPDVVVFIDGTLSNRLVKGSASATVPDPWLIFISHSISSISISINSIITIPSLSSADVGEHRASTITPTKGRKGKRQSNSFTIGCCRPSVL